MFFLSSKKNKGYIKMERIVFGPVPSRRLGQSLGINNIPPKICSYSCVYCQVGKTKNFSIERENFYKVEEIVENVEKRLNEIRKRGEKVDYLSFVPDGEPTLDVNLGEEISQLKKFKIKIAVITNSSLLWKDDVRKDIGKADWVSCKVDAVSENIWEKVNRPITGLDVEKIKKGIVLFSNEYNGKLVTETMLVKGINDSKEEIEKISEFLKKVKPDICYISVPTRPPAEKWVGVPEAENINIAYQIFKKKDLNVEILTGIGGSTFGFTGKVKEDILGTTSVHPMTEQQIEKLLEKSGEKWEVVENLLKEGFLREVEFDGRKYFLRNFQKE